MLGERFHFANPVNATMSTTENRLCGAWPFSFASKTRFTTKPLAVVDSIILGSEKLAEKKVARLACTWLF